LTNLRDKTVVITGGTGSFGRTATRRLLNEGIGRIRILSRDELKQDEMRQEFGEDRLDFHLGDVRDRASVDAVMRGADLVFHAAALKQVPSSEFFPMQAVQTNIQGSDNVVQAAITAGVSSVVCLGTDKAAYPINAMGMTKALMEKVAQSHARLASNGGTMVSTVRYGNVMASRGSVIPLFVRQIQAGGPVTITEPSMTRFLLSLPTAMDLVLYAFEHAEPGDLFVRKAPAATVGDLSRALQNLLEREVEESVIGMRHGEKLFETLATREEMSRAEDTGDYYRVRMDDRDLNYSLYFSEGDTTEHKLEDYTSHNTLRLSVPEIEDLLRTLPEVREALAR
jgi:UDP-N-acetylglucosamine 4,6-dehydratase/5-epimerase